ncbi:diguanylate cyclase [Azonexus sp. IMCC34839]|uniref:diguanylate cyclase n=1 Tax=Azonexus sp. IMCC34839 TaxID=3133695 RepID=UPI00399B772A
MLPGKLSWRITSLLPIAVFTVLALVVHFLANGERQQQILNAKSEASQKALLILSRLESELNTNSHLVNGLIAFATTSEHTTSEYLDSTLKAVFQFTPNLRRLAIAPKNTVSHVYPQGGSSTYIGNYLPDDPLLWPIVGEAVEQRKRIMVGPLTLPGEALGMLSTTPVFLTNGEYWGQFILEIDFESLISSANLAPEIDGMEYALGRKEAGDKSPRVFLGKKSLFEEDTVRLSLPIAGGVWTLATRPVSGWKTGFDHLDALEIGGFASSLLLAWLVWLFQRARQRTEANEQRLRTYLETTRDGVIAIDEHGLIQEFNPAAEALFGYRADEILGKSLQQLMPATDAALKDTLAASTSDQSRTMAFGRQINGVRKDGTQFPAEVTVGSNVNDESRLHVAIVRDVSERLNYELKLLDLATTDPLTGSMNRRSFVRTAAAALQMSRRNGKPLALIMLDADHFKKVNDTYGHAVGDLVLKKLSATALDSLRGTDSFGRFGGEEFVILLPETDLGSAILVIERLLDNIRACEVISDAGELVKFTVSAGIAISNPDDDTDALIRRADEALYEAKKGGRNRWVGPQE